MLFDKIQGTEKYAGQSKPAAATIFHFLTPLQMRKLSFGVARSPSPGSTASRADRPDLPISSISTDVQNLLCCASAAPEITREGL